MSACLSGVVGCEARPWRSIKMPRAEKLSAISVRCSSGRLSQPHQTSVVRCPGQWPAVTLRPIAAPTTRNRCIESDPNVLSGVEGNTAHRFAADSTS